MSRYAETTTVSSESSRAEIERTLTRYGATQFMYGWNEQGAVVGFIADGRQVRFTLPLPDKSSREFTHTPSKGLRRSEADAEKAWEQGVRQSWRALALVIKAKLEAVQAGIVTFEQEFAMHYMLPNGQTFGEWASPQIKAVYDHGGVPALLPGTKES